MSWCARIWDESTTAVSGLPRVACGLPIWQRNIFCVRISGDAAAGQNSERLIIIAERLLPPGVQPLGWADPKLLMNANQGVAVPKQGSFFFERKRRRPIAQQLPAQFLGIFLDFFAGLLALA